MWKISKDLSPDDTKVSYATAVKLRESAIEDVPAHVQGDARNHCLSSLVTERLLVWTQDREISMQAHYLSDIQLKTYDTGTWMNKPTAASALLDNPG